MNTLYSLLLLTCFGLFMATPVHAEDSIEWGALHSSAAGDYRTIIGEDAEHVYVYAVSMKRDYIEAYTRDAFEKVYAVEIRDEELEDRKARFESFYYKGTKTYLFYSTYERSTKTKRLYITQLDNKTGEQSTEYQRILEIPAERRKAVIRVSVSEDESKILVRHRVHSAVLGYTSKTMVQYMLLDSSLSLLQYTEESFDFVVPTTNPDLATQPVLENDGSMFFVKMRRENLQYSVDLVGFNGRKNWERTQQQLQVNNKRFLTQSQYVNGLRLTTNAKGELALVAYLSEKVMIEGKKKPRLRFTGALYITLNKRNKKIKDSKVSRFSAAFLDKFKTAKDKRKGRQGTIPNQFHNIELIKKSDGGLVLIGELYEHTITRLQSRTSGTRTVGEDFLYGDLLVLNFSAKGDLLWSNLIEKKQIYWWQESGIPFLLLSSRGPRFGVPPARRTTQYFSYQASVKPNELVFLFNDNPKNYENIQGASIVPFRRLNKVTMTRVAINLETGEQFEGEFETGQDEDVLFRPMNDHRGTAAESIFVLGSRGRKYKFGEYNIGE